MAEEGADAFGYVSSELDDVEGLLVREGTHPETLLPVVALFVGLRADERYGYALTLDQAEDLSGQLAWAVQRAREKHWE